MEERIRVAVRVRPSAAPEAIQFNDQQSQLYVFTNSTHEKAATFRCERFLAPSMAQDQVFEAIQAPELIEAALDGFPVTIFAYGQTGAGKSFTIFGKEDGHVEKRQSLQPTDGVLPRTAVHLMQLVDQRKKRCHYRLRVTCVEIYNEQVKDLFDPRKESLAVRHSKEHGFFLDNATVVQCTTAAELLRVIKLAAANRIKSSHLLNERSNRSHCLVTIYIDSTPVDPAFGEVKKYGKLTIVDLAGSERATDTGAVGMQLKETGHINKSLYCLSQVIQAMNAKQNNKFVPYRDSKLTMLLLDSLGGNSKTLMLACVNGSPQFTTESIRTLEFAMGVAKIKNRPTALLNPHEKLICDLKEQIRLLKLENMMLRSRTAGYFLDHLEGLDVEDLESSTAPKDQIEKTLLTERRRSSFDQLKQLLPRQSHEQKPPHSPPPSYTEVILQPLMTKNSSKESTRTKKSSTKTKKPPKKKQLDTRKSHKQQSKTTRSMSLGSSNQLHGSSTLPPVPMAYKPQPTSQPVAPSSLGTWATQPSKEKETNRTRTPPPEYDDLFGVETVAISSTKPALQKSSSSRLVLEPLDAIEIDNQRVTPEQHIQHLLSRMMQPETEEKKLPARKPPVAAQAVVTEEQQTELLMQQLMSLMQ